MKPRREWVCANCDWIGSPIDDPDVCPSCGLTAADVLSLTGNDEDEPEELRA